MSWEYGTEGGSGSWLASGDGGRFMFFLRASQTNLSSHQREERLRSDHTWGWVLMIKSGHVVLNAGKAAVHLATGGVRTLIGWLGHTAMVQKLVHVVAESQPRHGGGDDLGHISEQHS
ncbi:hypothetical protein E2C01_003133 [Portunus trituberculatus]|uniref:Uncharacterized protein n=1 Tax=Portunus trituberculatus TaxID=210409 RepID=A0A5B7CMW5_PORTR|nr:hypothetical protein [Portunus trituberculatus]